MIHIPISYHVLLFCMLPYSILTLRTPTPRPEPPEPPASVTSFTIELLLCVLLVLSGGWFAGMTIGYMSLDITNLEIIAQSGDGVKRNYARKIVPIRKHGHWLLSSLLIGNVAVNETLPIIMDSLFATLPNGGFLAVVLSTGAVVIFGEILPNAVGARYGLLLGAKCAFAVRMWMYLTFPISWPVGKALDAILGKEHKMWYKRAELKALVTLHQESGRDVDGEEGGTLLQDEVTIIQSVLDLKDKRVSQCMTPLEDVVMLSLDQVMDRPCILEILRTGHSRLPVYEGTRSNLVGMLLVKRLVGYDPLEERKVADFPLYFLPMVSSDTALFDMLHFFQEGRSHMALVMGNWNCPKERETLGIITLEDVIEELIGSEIVDESDQYVDVHSRIRVLRRVGGFKSMEFEEARRRGLAYISSPLKGGGGEGGRGEGYDNTDRGRETLLDVDDDGFRRSRRGSLTVSVCPSETSRLSSSKGSVSSFRYLICEEEEED